ncbi:MAG TPA: site-2 protease family protein [Pirellulales bacterium]|nr:site-2 protease family protein [Pirellulales bacterium]
MLLAEPPPNPWDLHFKLLGIPVRITPWFWLANVVLGWSFASSLAKSSQGALTVGTALLMWTAVVLISIIAHEFGHAFAFRFYGIHSHVVLYHFGGIAVPDSSFDFGRRMHLGSVQQIVIAAAGPAASLALGAVFVGIVYFGGFYVPNPLPFIHPFAFLLEGERVPSVALQGLLYAILFVNIGWALMNLLPVYPLDGGQISREMFTLGQPREGIRNSLILSILVAGAVAVWALSKQDTFLAIMFGMLAYSSFMTLQAYMGRGGGWR